jgi:hypothetical protein
MKDEEILYYINVGWVQAEAKQYINRRLTESELLSVKKGLDWGLNTDIDTVFKAAITGAVEITREEKRNKRIKTQKKK